MKTTNGISEIGFWVLTWVFFMSMACTCQGIPQAPYNVRVFGAWGDGTAKDTQAVQKAIDTCEKAGGGTVHFPAGTYLCGSLHLRSNVTLWLDSGATLRASSEESDFDPFEDLGFENDSDDETSYFHFALLWGEDVENIGIVGKGTIDSNRTDRTGPKTIALKRCKQVTLRDITIRNAGNYAISMLGTDFVNIDGVSIFSSYCDGIDPDCCHNVRISNCFIESWDDAIVPKASFSLGYRRSTEHITVTNCIMATSCNAFKLGTESGGDFRNITVSDCVMTTYQTKVDYREPTPPISGISLISVDGSNINGINITNISMDRVRFPVFVRLGNRGRDLKEPVPGTIDHVNISNITATKARIGSIIIGLPNKPIENLHLDNIQIDCVGGGAKGQPWPDIPKAMLKYPSANKFRDLPTYGCYSRHAAGITFEDIRVSVESKDTRHAFLCEDVSDLRIDSLKVQGVEDGAAMILLKNVRGAMIQGCRPSQDTTIFLEVSGEKSCGISLFGNELSGVGQLFLLRPGVDKGAVRSKNGF